MGLEGQVDRSRRSDGWFQEVGWMSLEGQLDGSRRSDGWFQEYKRIGTNG